MLKQLNLSNVQHTLSATSRCYTVCLYRPEIYAPNIYKHNNRPASFDSYRKKYTTTNITIPKLQASADAEINQNKILKLFETLDIKTTKKILTKKIELINHLEKIEKQKALQKNILKKKHVQAKEKEKKRLESKKKKMSKMLTGNKEIIKMPELIYNPYNFFTKAEFKKLKSDPLITIELKTPTQIFTRISKKWKLLTEAEKLEYDQKIKLLKQLYTAKLHKWWDDVDKNLVKLENRRRRFINKIRKANGIRKLSMLVDPRKPKRPMMVYLMFSDDLKKSNNLEVPNKNTDFSKYTSAKWKELPESEKDIYRNKFASAFKLYKEALNKFQSGQIQNNI
ncbi:hypothetical protein BB561_005680 [Smittium simulii]|uniref:HMG box domain-containing protein n=1 Tax=Smittium simulii TaxID=133385 RepID=A0A2T9Y923_9FUNG|nr:hypothetical protein BB561_005680 [Smittium simulii]